MLQKTHQKTHVVFNVQNAGEPGKRDQESGNNAVASKDDEKDSSAPQTNQRVATVRFDEKNSLPIVIPQCSFS